MMAPSITKDYQIVRKRFSMCEELLPLDEMRMRMRLIPFQKQGSVFPGRVGNTVKCGE